jgi:hypothetical protein
MTHFSSMDFYWLVEIDKKGKKKNLFHQQVMENTGFILVFSITRKS